MTASQPQDEEFLWATRGRTWGFRFVRRAGFDDPLPVYEAAFASIGDTTEAWCRVGDTVALRFLDPEGRLDAAGRAISHDFVLFGDRARGITSLTEGRQRIWPEVADEFEQVWEDDQPPARG